MLNASLANHHHQGPFSAVEADPQCLCGTYTALVTPFRETINDPEIDWPALARLIEEQVRNKCGIVLLGTTGECPTIESDERVRLTEFCRREAGGRVPLIVGTGTYSTKESIDRTKLARDQGVDAALLVSPYYNKPSQNGLRKHFESIADEVSDFSVILYDVPGRCGAGMTAETIITLSRHSSIVGLKWASGDIAQLQQIIHRAPHTFSVVSGDDNRTHEAMQQGARGVISVLSNLLPARVRALVECHLRAREGGGAEDQLRRAENLHAQLLPLMQGCFLQSNPLPIKTSLAVRGDIQEVFRLPLCPMDKEFRDQWISLLEREGIIPASDIAKKG